MHESHDHICSETLVESGVCKKNVRSQVKGVSSASSRRQLSIGISCGARKILVQELLRVQGPGVDMSKWRLMNSDPEFDSTRLTSHSGHFYDRSYFSRQHTMDLSCLRDCITTASVTSVVDHFSDRLNFL